MKKEKHAYIIENDIPVVPPDMDNIHERANGIRRKFSANGDHKKFFPACESYHSYI